MYTFFKSFSQSITDIDPDLMVGLNGFEEDLPRSKVTYFQQMSLD